MDRLKLVFLVAGAALLSMSQTSMAQQSYGNNPQAGAFPPQQIQQIPQNQPMVNPAIPGVRQDPAVHAANVQAANARANLYTPAPIRIKDITTIEGHRSNRVSGFGLVTGLKGTGGKSKLTQETGRKMLKNFGIVASDIGSGSLSVVAVTAEIPPFARPGEVVMATVSVYDDATSLFGGVLQTSALRGIDKRVYAVAAGPLLASGFSASGEGASVAKNHDTTGVVEAQMEVGIQMAEPAFPDRFYRLLLKNKDYATAHRIARQINSAYPGHARALDQGTVDVYFPPQFIEHKIDFVVRVNEMRVTPDIPARVIVNQKTGTVIVGRNVKINKVMHASENLVVTTTENPIAAQPAPFSDGQTVVLPRTQITTNESGGSYNVLNHQTTVGELSSLLNTLGVPPREMITILQALHASGDLQGHLQIQ